MLFFGIWPTLREPPQGGFKLSLRIFLAEFAIIIFGRQVPSSERKPDVDRLLAFRSNHQRAAF